MFLSNNKFTNLILLLFTGIAFVAGVLFYIQLPAGEIATHWNTAGDVDGYMGKFWGVFLLPFVMGGLLMLYWVVPKIDPFKANIESFKKYYNLFWLFLFFFMFYVYGLQMMWNFGARFDVGRAVVPALALLWYVVGVVVGNAKRNWFMGIRTPWTLSSDVVWNKTHKLGGNLFKCAALLSLAGLLFAGDVMFYFAIIPVVMVALVTIVYSYVEYRKLTS